MAETDFSDNNPYLSPALQPRLPTPKALPSSNDRCLTACFVYTSDYFTEAFVRYRAQRRWRLIWLVLRGIAALGFASFTLAAISTRQYFVGIFCGAFTLMLIAANRLDNWRVRRALATSPYRNAEITLHLSEAEYEVLSAMEHSRLRWSLFSNAVIFDDGILIFHGPRVFRWVPFSALLDGSLPDEFVALVQSKITCCDDRRSRR